MTPKFLLVPIVMAGVICATVSNTRAAQHFGGGESYQPFQTIWSGVYTKAEADRGKETAARLCGSCHGADLKGAAIAPGLTGEQFFVRWDNLRLLDVVAYIQAAMPHGHEFFVSADSTREIVGFMLHESGVPAGDTPISRDVEVLNSIMISRPRVK